MIFDEEINRLWWNEEWTLWTSPRPFLQHSGKGADIFHQMGYIYSCLHKNIFVKLYPLSCVKICNIFHKLGWENDLLNEMLIRYVDAGVWFYSHKQTVKYLTGIDVLLLVYVYTVYSFDTVTFDVCMYNYFSA